MLNSAQFYEVRTVARLLIDSACPVCGEAVSLLDIFTKPVKITALIVTRHQCERCDCALTLKVHIPEYEMTGCIDCQLDGDTLLLLPASVLYTVNKSPDPRDLSFNVNRLTDA